MSAQRHDFTVKSTSTVYSGAIVALRLDQLGMPGGRVAEREIVEHYGAVAVVALDDDDNVVLIDQYRHPVGRRLWELPAGLLDGGPEESPLAAAQRELAEETGLAARKWSVLVDIVVSPGFTDEGLRIFLARGLSEVERPEPEDEEADLRIARFSLAKASEMVFDGEIVNATAVSGILAAAAVPKGRELRGPDAQWPTRPTAFEDRRRR